MNGPDPVRRRRSPAAVRDDVLRAAHEVFGERGFASARTREIADRAGVTEQMIYRHFPSKVALFEQAVFVPFSAMVDSYLQEFAEREPRHLSVAELARDYVEQLYRFLRGNRQLLIAIIAANEHNPSLFGWGPEGPLGPMFAALEKAVAEISHDQGFDHVDPPLVVRSCFAMVLSIAVHGDALLGLGDQQETDQLIDEITASVLVIAERPPASVVLADRARPAKPSAAS